MKRCESGEKEKPSEEDQDEAATSRHQWLLLISMDAAIVAVLSKLDDDFKMARMALRANQVNNQFLIDQRMAMAKFN